MTVFIDVASIQSAEHDLDDVEFLNQLRMIRTEEDQPVHLLEV